MLAFTPTHGPCETQLVELPAVARPGQIKSCGCVSHFLCSTCTVQPQHHIIAFRTLENQPHLAGVGLDPFKLQWFLPAVFDRDDRHSLPAVPGQLDPLAGQFQAAKRQPVGPGQLDRIAHVLPHAFA